MHCFLPAIEAEGENGMEDALACDYGGHMAVQVTLDIPEPRNRRQAMEPPEWDKCRKAEETEMVGMIENCVYMQVARPKDKLVAGTKMIYNAQTDLSFRVLAGGRCTLHGKVLAHASDRVNPDAFGDDSGQGRRAAPFRRGAGIFVKADIDEEIYVEIPEEFQEFPGAVGRLNKAIYGLVQAGRCWNNKFCDDMTAIGFEQAKADPCVFRKVVGGEAEMAVAVHVEDILAHAKDQATMDRLATELEQKFKLKDMGDTGYYMGCHITRNRKARELKPDQHLYVESMA